MILRWAKGLVAWCSENVGTTDSLAVAVLCARCIHRFLWSRLV